MARFELKLPKMGESVAEATITSWLKEVGDTIEMDEAIVEIATDKVDSEVPSEVEGTLVEMLFEKDDVVAVGATIAVIETEGGTVVAAKTVEEIKAPVEVVEIEKEVAQTIDAVQAPISKNQIVGKMLFKLGEEEVGSVDLVTVKEVKSQGVFGRAWSNIKLLVYRFLMEEE